MPLANSVLDVVLQLAGLFYAFAGYVGVRAVHQARLLDAALDELSAEFSAPKTPVREHRRMLWLLAGALLTLAGGVALLLQADIAAWIFFGSAAMQFVYLLGAAPYYFDQTTKPDGPGRQGSNNAAILYAVVTVCVLWASQNGHLKPLSEIAPELCAAAALGFAGYTLFALWKFAKPFHMSRAANAESEDDTRG